MSDIKNIVVKDDKDARVHVQALTDKVTEMMTSSNDGDLFRLFREAYAEVIALATYRHEHLGGVE